MFSKLLEFARKKSPIKLILGVKWLLYLKSMLFLIDGICNIPFYSPKQTINRLNQAGYKKQTQDLNLSRRNMTMCAD